MGDGVDLAGVVGTWIAAGLAIVALVGIVTPWVLLREARSDRFRVLNTIDSQNTGYVQGGLELRSGFRSFQRIKVPLLQEAPGPRLGIQLRESSALQALGSATGWVNLAAILETYATPLRKGDQIVISQGEPCLPVHRFWIMIFGLFGRYGKRRDRGLAINQSNAMRLMIEGRRSSTNSEQIYYGITGKLFWSPTTQETAPLASTVMDKVFFKIHSVESRESLSPDPMPLSLLFWLRME